MLPRPEAAAVAALLLTACATAHPGPPPRHASGHRTFAPLEPVPQAIPSAQVEPRTLPLTALRGWEAEDHAAALNAYREACGAARDPALARACRNARALGPLAEEQAERYFEANFRAERLAGEGVLTAYFAPEYPARHRSDDAFSAPVRPRPSDLKIVDAGLFDTAQAGRPGAARDTGDSPLAPYPDRAEIEAMPADRPLAWMRPEDLFFLQIQGSGVLTFEDGTRMKALYAANNGRAFVGIANALRDQGLLARDNTSGEAIRAWLADHRGPQAQAVMRLNPRYAFFSLAPDDGRQPVGSANLPLPPGRALAMDPAYHQPGELYWIDAGAPILQGAFPTYRRLAVALDTGGAIRGDIRADLYLGRGAAAGFEAGRVRHTLRLYRLIPKDASP